MAFITIPIVGGIATPNLALGPNQYILATSNFTLALPINGLPDTFWTLIVRQDATGGRAITTHSGYYGDLSGWNTTANTESQVNWLIDSNGNNMLNSEITGTSHP